MNIELDNATVAALSEILKVIWGELYGDERWPIDRFFESLAIARERDDNDKS